MEEKSAEKATPVEVPWPLEGASVRRRLIQSTLFPHRSEDVNKKESAIKEDENCEEDDDHDDEDDDYCGSQSKRKKRKRKPNRTPKSRASKKVAIDGKETLSNRVDDEGSPVIIRSDFFLKVSERQHQLKQQNEQLSVGLPEEDDRTCSSPHSAANMKSPWLLKQQANATPKKQQGKATPKKQQANVTPKKPQANATPKKQRWNTTPRKKSINCCPKEACSRKMTTDSLNNEHISQPIPDLRLEAKMSAEENSRIFVGKQMHPFFSSWKIGKKNQETIDVESNWCPVERQDRSIPFNPIHIFEKVKDDAVTLDWGNWIFSESTSVNICCGLESTWEPVYEGSTKSLQFDNFPCAFHPTRSSLCQNEFFLDQCSIQHEEVVLGHSPIQGECLHTITPRPLADEQMALWEQLKDIEQNHEMDKAESFSRNAGCLNDSHVEFQGQFLQERMMSYYHDCENQHANRLWTNKYQPEKAIEVCGNDESVKFISDWLRLWHERGFRTSKNGTSDKWTVCDVEYSGDQSDCDYENIDEETNLKNVLLVTGPVGSGKSAAVYACAKEQGFQIIEINASDWRSGALVKQKFGEAVESHWLHRTPENPANTESKHLLKCTPATPNTTAAQVSENEVIELITFSDEEDSQNAGRMGGKTICNENRTVSDRSEVKTLILFEDVDATPYEDRGFITTIQQLAATAKRPMILTSNCNNPALPNNLDRLEVCFTIPSSKELLPLVYMVCAAEKAKVQPCLVERFIGYCQGDIRKTIMHLQFWCQDQNYSKDNEVQKTYGSLLFDLDAGHQILPKIISWGYHSQLSEIVEKEITKSLLTMEENSTFSEIVEEEEQNHNELQNSLRMHNSEPDGIEAKKEVMLNRHCSIQDGDEFPAKFDTIFEFPNSSGSPVAFTRRNVRRKLDVVVSSDSEECLNYKSPVVLCKLFEDANNELHLEVNSESPSHCLASEMSLDPLNEEFFCVNGEKLDGNPDQCSETADYLQINETHKTFDVSFVPESTFVPETEIDYGTRLFSRTVSCGHGVDTVEAVSINNDSISNLLPFEDNNLYKSFTPTSLHKIPDMLRNTCINTESVHGEEVGDSYIEHVQVVTRGYQVMDECSRMVFSRGSELMEKARSLRGINCVQEAWRKLRDSHMDLRQYVTSEEKNTSEVLNLACGMSNLISEADLLLGYCKPHLCDALESSMFPLEKSHSFSWYDDQLQMTSTTAQHGICFYAKEVGGMGPKLGSLSRVDLAWEMLTSTNNAMAFGKLVRQNKRLITGLEMGPPPNGISLKRELDSCLCNIVQSIVPARSYLRLKGEVFHEYLSSLSQISRSEASRLSDSVEKTRRRRPRVARHYLSTGALMLSPEDISFLGQYNCYQKVSSNL